MIDVRFPRRVDGSGNTVEEYHPLSMSLDLRITPLSTATMALPRSEFIPARSFVELFTPIGSAGFFRVRSPEDAYGEDITSVELEHAITEVGDYLVKAEYDEMMAATTAMQTVFQYYGGGRWQLGSVSALGTGQIAFSVNYDRVLDAMLGILEQVEGTYLAFNFSTTPWTVSVAKKETSVSAEGRLSRNIDSARIIYDDTELCTRVYYERETTTDTPTADMNLEAVPTFSVDAYYSAGTYVLYNGKIYELPSGHEAGETWANTTSVLKTDIPTTEWAYLDADTVSTYGLVERTVSTSSDYTDSEALRVAQEYLRTHKEPKITVQVQAEELSHATGESWDTFTIGKLMRLALVDYGVTVERNITELSWDDVYGEPESMEVVLGEEEDTAIQYLHDVDASGGTDAARGGGGGGGSKKQEDKWKEFRTGIDKTDVVLDLWARQYKQTGEVVRQAGMYIDANGAIQYADDNERHIGGRLKVQADKVAMVVGTKADGENYIKAAEIAVSINEDGTGNANIMADHIYIGPISGADSDYTGKTLDGTVTAITSDFTTVNTLLAKKIEADDINATTVTAALSKAALVSVQQLSASTAIGCSGTISCSDLSVSTHNMNIYDGQVSSDGKTLTLFRLSGGSLSFNKAPSATSVTLVQDGGVMKYKLKDDSGTEIDSGEKKIENYHPSIHYNAAWGLTREGYMAAGTTIDTSGYYYSRSSNMALMQVWT